MPINLVSVQVFFFTYSFICLFILTSLLEYICFTMICQFLLYNKVNQLYRYIYPHIPSLLHLPPTLPIPPLQVDTKNQADLPVLCGCFPLAIFFFFPYQLSILYTSVYTCQSQSPNSAHHHPHPTVVFPPWCPYVCSLHLCLCFCPGNWIICTIFLGSTYMH